MKISKIDIGEIQIPLVTPFKTSLRTATHVDDILVRITADTGETGYGEAPPTAVITGDTKGSIRAAISEFIAPSLIGMEIIKERADSRVVLLGHPGEETDVRKIYGLG